MQTPQQNPASPATAPINVDAIIAKMQIPPNLKGIYDKAVLSGLRIMFSKNSFSMTQQQLDKPGPMAEKVAQGTVAVMYMLYQQSNKTLPPQIMIPVVVTLTLRAFDFLQKAHDPEATPDVLGDAVSGSIDGIMRAFGLPPEQLPQILQGIQQKAAANGGIAPVSAPQGAGNGS